MAMANYTAPAEPGKDRYCRAQVPLRGHGVGGTVQCGRLRREGKLTCRGHDDLEDEAQKQEATMDDRRPFRNKPTAKALFELLDRLRHRAFDFEEIAPPPPGDTRPVYNVTVKDQDCADAHDVIERLVFGGK
jgi:hypothetical protein